MLVTTSAFSAYVYHRAEQRIDKDAGLLLELQLAQLIEHMDATPGAVGEWREFAERQASSGDPELRIGIEYFDPEGRSLVSAGAAEIVEVPLPQRVLMGRSDPGPREVDTGWSYPYLVLSGRGQQGIAQLMVYSRPFARSAAAIRDAFWTAAPVMLLLTALLGFLLSRGSLRPIATIARSARRISTRRLDEQIPTTGSGDELDQLATTLNEMLDRIREGVERVHAFSADAAHQLRTPLNAMQGEIDVTLAKDRTAEEYRSVLGNVYQQVVTLADTVNGILRLAQSEGGLDANHTLLVEVDSLLEDVVDFFAVLAEERGIELRLIAESKGSVRGDPTWLHQLFANLIHNAILYTPAGGSVSVEARPADGEALVRVCDTGPGMSNADRAIAFARMQRGSASETGEGLGLGLSLAREIARAHHGTIEIESPPGGGSVFAVRLPLAPDTPS